MTRAVAVVCLAWALLAGCQTQEGETEQTVNPASERQGDRPGSQLTEDDI
ncbi:hypothetical protein [Brevundimonas sp.]|nr:hypothetical protein [Brevundimonas sp.]